MTELKNVFPGLGIPIIKLEWLILIFIMGIPLLIRNHLYMALGILIMDK